MHDTHLAELMAQRTALDAQITEAKLSHFTDVLGQVRDTLKAHGIAPEDAARALLGSRKKSKSSSGQKVAPKYRDSTTGALWTGRGKAPTRFTWSRVDNGDIAVLR